MTTYNVLLHPDVDAFLNAADAKTERICRTHLGYLKSDPYPGSGKGDKERLPVDGQMRYRLHISRTYTALYDVYDSRREVRVLEIMTIDEAHKRFGF